MAKQHRADNTITESEDGFETETEVGFGSSGTWDSIEQCGHLVLSDLQNGTWERRSHNNVQGQSTVRSWYDGTHRKQINQAMREASDAFDLAYHKSQTDGDLLKNTEAVTKALAKVRRHVRANRYPT